MNVEQAGGELSFPCYYTRTSLELCSDFPQRSIMYFIYFH